MSPLDERAGEERYLATACQIGARLLAEAVWHDDRCTWLGDDMTAVDGEWQVTHRSVGGELYSGTAGIALFLGALWNVTGEAALRSAAEAAMRQGLRSVKQGSTDTRFGLYDGACGIAWTALQLGELLDSEELASAGAALSLELADEVLSGSRQHDATDLVSGASGAILAFLAVAASSPDDRLLGASIALGDRLLAEAHVGACGWSWSGADAVAMGEPDLCGLGHGASGVAYALLELHAATGDASYLEAATAGARYERGWFHRSQSNWPDLRGMSHDDLAGGQQLAFPAFWCHGAVGIGLARLRAYELTGDRVALAEAGAALQAGRTAALSAAGAAASGAETYEGNFSLCHGLAGTAELQTVAYETLGVQEHLEAARWIGDLGIQTAAAQGGRWSCGVPGGGEAPGLMLGLAGIGACYLRLHDPAQTPSIGLLAGRPRRVLPV